MFFSESIVLTHIILGGGGSYASQRGDEPLRPFVDLLAALFVALDGLRHLVQLLHERCNHFTRHDSKVRCNSGVGRRLEAAKGN